MAAVDTSVKEGDYYVMSNSLYFVLRIDPGSRLALIENCKSEKQMWLELEKLEESTKVAMD